MITALILLTALSVSCYGNTIQSVTKSPPPDLFQSTQSCETDYFDGYFSTDSPKESDSNNVQCGTAPLNKHPNPAVLGGAPSLEGQWPWQVALYQTQTVDNVYVCGGTLVSNRHVITAAHCVTRRRSLQKVNKHSLTVYLGKNNLRTSVNGVQIKFVDNIIVHPEYNVSTFSRDIAILVLRDQAVQFSDWVRPICLWPENQIDLQYVVGRNGSVVGWGFDESGKLTEVLNMAEMPVVDQETCLRSHDYFYVRFTSSYTYCAGNRAGSSVSLFPLNSETAIQLFSNLWPYLFSCVIHELIVVSFT